MTVMVLLAIMNMTIFLILNDQVFCS